MEYYYRYRYAYRPAVSITCSSGSWRIKIDGIDRAVEVVLLENVIQSKIDGESSGFEGDTVFKLTNGQIWQQTEYYYRYRYAYRPEVLIFWSSGAWKIQIEGIDRAVRVTRVK